MSRIAILSDIHFGEFCRASSFYMPGEEVQDKSKGIYSLKEGLIELFNEMNPQYFFVAGDLTSLGNPQEFYYCEQEILNIAKRTGVECNNIFCVLGNHDIDWSISDLGINVQNVGKEVGKIVKCKYQMIAANCAKINIEYLGKNYDAYGPAPFSGVVEKDDFVLFVLNTGRFCTRDQQFSHGKLERDQMEWFEEISREYKSDDRIKILLMHHHPINYPYPMPGIDISTIEEGAELMKIASQNGINIIIHGHRHHPRVETIQIESGTEPIVMICAGSLSVNAEHRNKGDMLIPNTVHFLDIDKGKSYYIVHNYKFTDVAGWEKIDKYCRETPIDTVMKVGKIYSKNEIVATIENYKNLENHILYWEDLNECLQFMPYNKLNNFFEEILRPTHNVVGKFPEQVVLLKK